MNSCMDLDSNEIITIVVNRDYSTSQSLAPFTPKNIQQLYILLQALYSAAEETPINQIMASILLMETDLKERHSMRLSKHLRSPLYISGSSEECNGVRKFLAFMAEHDIYKKVHNVVNIMPMPVEKEYEKAKACAKAFEQQVAAAVAEATL